MKKLILLIFACALAGGLSAQEVEPRAGYIGISFGPAFPMGDIDDDAISGGAHLNLINFGYVIGKNVGVAGTWFGTSFLSEYDDDYSVGMGGLLFGPLFSTSSKSGSLDFDFKPMIGFGRGSEIYDGDIEGSSSSAFAFGLGGAIRWNCSDKISLSIGMDYYSCRPDDIDLSSLAVVLGINFRLR